ncbi:type II toxin-antitoxin system Phd/YefM family antitoxin [Brevundimonas sp. TWP2-3-2]|uniref:type II toxin-antitoxin system Phd/YefM family antitoxin n=1 Tax=unclassified Brevundimonas TaxID=2622653 RepID=UPI003CF09E3B
MATVTVHHAKTHLSKLIAAAERGEEVIIARGNKPAVRISAIEPADVRPKRQFGSMKGLISIDDRFFEPLPEEDILLWEGRGDGDD